MTSEHRSELARQQLRDMLRGGIPGALLNFFAIVLCAILFAGVVSAEIAILSIALVTVSSVARLALCARWRAPDRREHVNRQRLRLFTALIAAGGIGWGLFFYSGFRHAAPQPDAEIWYALLLAVMFALIVSSIVLSSSYWQAVLAFGAPVLVSVAGLGVDFTDRTLAIALIVTVAVIIALSIVTRTRFAGYKDFVMLKSNNERLLKAYREQKEIAESSSRAKSRFLAAASHDLRQPIHAIGLLSDTLESQAEQPQLKALSQSITESVNDLTALLEVILDISRIDAGLIRPALESFPIARLFFNLHKTFGNAAFNKALDFRVRNSGLIVRSDPVLLERILSNLVSNAIKYTDEGGLLVAARRIGTESVRIEVWDTGVGIPSDALDEVFLEYYQIGNVGRSDNEGLGLGLSIVKGLCETLDYPLSVRSEHTRGTVFTVTVPQSQDSESSVRETALDASAEGAARLLLIDDDKRVLGATRQLLSSRGYDTRIAETGDAASEIIRRGYRPDIVVCDYRLADGVNGTDVLDRIRAEFGAHIAGLLITADTDTGRLLDARDSGYPLLHKPLSAVELRVTLARLQERQTDPWRQPKARSG